MMSFAVEQATLSRSGYDFIDEARLHGLLTRRAQPGEVRGVLAKSLAKEPLTVEETAVLLAAEGRDLAEEIFDAARQLKQQVYGNRIVIFAPLYVGNDCTNDCQYCAFRRSNRAAIRRTLAEDELRQQVRALESKGHKRLILVFGEHPDYDAHFMAECMHHVYATRGGWKSGMGASGRAAIPNPQSSITSSTAGHGEIRRLSLNAAPLDHDGYRIVKAAGIATYQIFQETYHHATYRRMHAPGTRKGNYLWRLDGVARAIEAECDDVGIGALFGLYDWRFEVLALVSHARHLMEYYNTGPHTISFPRLRPAQGVRLDEAHLVGEADFKRLVAILRLSVPYTGLVCTAREPPAVRREVLPFGVSQIDAGSRIELGGYTEGGEAQAAEREQFELGDIRPLDAVVRELLVDGYIPSFCTACYRLGRTGEQFMGVAIPGFIHNLCTPNALSTLMEYLVDYATPETRAVGKATIRREVEKLPDGERKRQLLDRLERIAEKGERDLYS